MNAYTVTKNKRYCPLCRKFCYENDVCQRVFVPVRVRITSHLYATSISMSMLFFVALKCIFYTEIGNHRIKDTTVYAVADMER